MADTSVQEEREGRSSSPPGRESREDWRGRARGQDKNGRASDADRKKKSRSRSRSPIRRRRRSFSPNREVRFTRDGTNTTSREPHLERARIFVGNIEPHCHRRDLIKLFSQHGEVLGVSVHKGYAFVQMDRERAANKAINFEDNKMFMGSKIHVEFSQAALKAGAKLERLSTMGSPPRMPPPPLPSRVLAIDPYVEEQERQREERLARILQMERELALLRAREGDVLNPKPPSRASPADPQDRDIYVRRSPGPSLGPPSSYQSSYSRERERERDNGVYGTGADAGGADRSRGYYGHGGRGSPPREYTTRGYTGGAGGNSSSTYREPVSYPTQIGSSNSSSSNRYGSSNSGGYSNSSGGYGNSTGGYGSRATATSVGYGGSSSGTKSKSSLPPGWPSTDKPMNQAPFSVGGPWS